MNRQWFILAGVITFSAAAAIVLSIQLASVTAMGLVLGLVIGVIVGMASGFALVWTTAPRGQLPRSGSNRASEQGTAVIMPSEQAEKLLRILGSRDQASPSDFPMTSEPERTITAVGGARLDDDYDE